MQQNTIAIPVGDNRYTEFLSNMEKGMLLDSFYIELKKLHSTIHAKAREQKKFIIYGAGVRGQRLVEQFFRLKQTNKIKWELCAIVDKKIDKIDLENGDVKVYNPEQLQNICFDYIVVSSRKYFNEIKRELISYCIDEEKIRDGLWLDFL